MIGLTNKRFWFEANKPLNRSLPTVVTLRSNWHKFYLQAVISRPTQSLAMNIKTIKRVNRGSYFLVCSDAFWSLFTDDNEIYKFTTDTLEQYISSLSNDSLTDNTTLLWLTKT